ncbi:MAG: alpha/beta hydrolase family protein [Pseudomonadota bacterium]|jgi:dipeptidyl aminopeptidase/acylaminoacyl peptidase
MRRIAKVLAVLCFGLALVGRAPATAAPLEAYGKLPTIESANVSPSGHAVALIVTNGEERMIVIQDLATKALTYRGATGRAKVRYVQWAGDDHLIIVTTMTASPMDVISTQREWAMGFSLDLRRKKVTPLLHDVDQSMNTIHGTPVVRVRDGGPVVFLQGVRFVGGIGRLSLFRVDLNSGKTRVVEVGGPDTRDWLVGPDGEPAAQELYDLKTGRWSIKLAAGSAWREAVSATALNDPPSMMGLSRDGRAVLYTARDQEERLVWQEARLDGATAGSPIVVSDGHGALYDSQDGRLIGQYALVGDSGRYTFFDPTDDKIWKAVMAAFPGAGVDLKSWSADHRKIVVRVDSPAEGPAYALVDIDTRRATWLGAEYQDVTAADVSPQTPIRYKAQDGLALTGYLTTPRGREARGLPLIVFPHGGPAARDTPGFDWWAQAMASRGYAVLQVNFRGSEGLGSGLLEAGYGQWGRKMQTDLSDGVRHLAAEGVIDPARVCIVGASYGGYAAMAGAALDPGVYRCAASFGGVSDLGRFVSWSRNKRGQAAFRYWTRFMGAEEDRSAILAEISPAQHADKVSIPILLIHGRDDSVVPLEQSRFMADALKKAGKPYELVIQKGEDHWLSRGETRLEMLKATMAFVEKHNPPE